MIIARTITKKVTLWLLATIMITMMMPTTHVVGMSPQNNYTAWEELIDAAAEANISVHELIVELSDVVITGEGTIHIDVIFGTENGLQRAIAVPNAVTVVTTPISNNQLRVDFRNNMAIPLTISMLYTVIQAPPGIQYVPRVPMSTG